MPGFALQKVNKLAWMIFILNGLGGDTTAQGMGEVASLRASPSLPLVGLDYGETNSLGR